MNAPRLSVESAAARMTWIQLDGPTVDAEADALLGRGIGGVVLFGRNIETPGQVLRLTTELRRRASGPLRICVDQEGGHIVRLRAPLTRFPSAMAVGATESALLARAVARATGEQLAVLGIDVDLAPVLDVAVELSNPAVGTRSYGGSAEEVARLGAAAVRGFLDAGVVPTPKHFPGHGRTPLDTHAGTATVAGGLEALRAVDLIPFRAAIAAGAPVVMVSQVVYEDVGEHVPATLSRTIMGDLLRGELAFDGLTLTDAMVMDGVARGRSVADASAQALIEGADVVMPLGHQGAVLTAIERAIEDGRLGVGRIEETLERIDRLERLVARPRPGTRPDPRPGTRPAPRPGTGPAPARDLQARLAPRADHERLAGEVARASLTRVRGSLELPIDASTSVALVELASSRPSPIEDALPGLSLLAPVLGERLPRLASILVRPDDPERALAEARAIELAGSVDVVILATRDSFLRSGAIELAGRLLDAGTPVIHVALRNPYDLVALPPAPVAIAAYSDVPATLRALSEALTTSGPASARFPGRLPVALPVVERPTNATYAADLSE